MLIEKSWEGQVYIGLTRQELDFLLNAKSKKGHANAIEGVGVIVYVKEDSDGKVIGPKFGK
jgi:hypothetical protein